MKIAGIAELKAHLSRYLASVKEGGEVLVTERGRTIARIVPERGTDDDQRVARLRRAGVARGPGTPLDESFLRQPRPADPEAAVRRAVEAEREEGW